LRLLFIESDAGVQRWISAQAEELGVDVSFVDNCSRPSGREHEPWPDAVVMDVTSCGELRGESWQRLCDVLNDRSVPLLVYSSASRMNTVAESLGKRCNGYLERPFTLEQAIARAREERITTVAPIGAKPVTGALTPTAARR
jgi:DNA-binding response OmpR family regulator